VSPPAARFAGPLGVLLGLGTTLAAIAALEGPDGHPSPTGVLVSDCDGPLEELVIHYLPAAAEVQLPAYRDFIGGLPAEVRIHVVCPDAAAFDDLHRRLGEHACTLTPVFADHAITGWSRDRWLLLQSPGEPPTHLLLSPRGEEGATTWAARREDHLVAEDLAHQPDLDADATRSELYFDGGDFVTDDLTTFVAPGVLRRNLGRTVADEEELTARLTQQLGRRVLLLDHAPDHHAGMFMMAAGNRTVLVGDPSAARDLPGIEAPLPGGADFSPATQARFDAVARRCEQAGYRVVRMPVLPAPDGRTYLSPLNAILDQREGRRIVHMPVYAGAEALNRAAQEIWEGLGYEVFAVDCTATYRHFGSLRCLVNVVRRGAPA